VLGGAVVAVLCVIYFLAPAGWFGQVTYLTVTVGASGVAWMSVRRHGGWSRLWLAVGISASALGDALYEAYVSLSGTVPDVSSADAAWIAS
jgi:phosphoglycerol transferase MdoB-like AlkP superfamily enzyme